MLNLVVEFYPLPKIVKLFSLFVGLAIFTGCVGLREEKSEEEITFFIGSDLHFGKDSLTKVINQAIADKMASLPGTPYLGSSELVGTPDWVSFTGDLTDHGRLAEWNDFIEVFDYDTGNSEAFPFMVYEGFGNHDGPIHGSLTSPIRSGIKVRNMKRKGIVNISRDSLHYSWDTEGVHFVNLNSYPGLTWDSDCEWCHYFKEGFREPSYSLNFLKKDLVSLKKKRTPVVLFFHYGFDEWGNKWWTEDEQSAFYDVIKEYNVIAIFHGHTHSIDYYRWKGIPVWCTGATQQSKKTGEYLVVRIRKDNMLVAVRSSDHWGEFFKIPLKVEHRK